MIQMYFNLVVAGRRTCNPETKDVTLVPEIYRSEVIQMLNEAGRDIDGKLI